MTAAPDEVEEPVTCRTFRNHEPSPSTPLEDVALTGVGGPGQDEGKPPAPS